MDRPWMCAWLLNTKKTSKLGKTLYLPMVDPNMHLFTHPRYVLPPPCVAKVACLWKGQVL